MAERQCYRDYLSAASKSRVPAWLTKWMRERVTCNPVNLGRLDLKAIDEAIKNVKRANDPISLRNSKYPNRARLDWLDEHIDTLKALKSVEFDETSDQLSELHQLFCNWTKRPRIQYLSFTGPHSTVIENAIIGKLKLRSSDLYDGTRNGPEIILRNCWIGEVWMEKDARAKVELLDCVAQKLDVRDCGTVLFWANGGVIEYVVTETPGTGTPFKGIAAIKDVYFPTNPDVSYHYQGAQTFSTLRSHFEEMENGPLTSLMRGLELECERPLDQGVNKLYSFAYSIFAGYGLKPGRALLWFLISLAVTTVILTQFDGGFPGLPMDTGYPGARNVFLHPDWGEWARSFYLALQAPFNPLGIFTAKKVVVANTMGGNIGLVLHGLFSDTMLIMAFMSVRRRFKLS